MARRTSQAELLTTCASQVENAVVGIISLVLRDETLDAELQELVRTALTTAHRLRLIGIGISERK